MSSGSGGDVADAFLLVSGSRPWEGGPLSAIRIGNETTVVHLPHARRQRFPHMPHGRQSVRGRHEEYREVEKPRVNQNALVM